MLGHAPMISLTHFSAVEKKEDSEEIFEFHYYGDWPVWKRQVDVHQYTMRPAHCGLVVDGEYVLAGRAVVPGQRAAVEEVER